MPERIPRRLPVSLHRGAAVSVSRVGISNGDKLVYVILANRKLNYALGRTRVAYIGTTTRSIARLAVSAAYRAPEILGLRGVTEFEVRVISCQPRRNVRTWAKLERALLLTFREMYGEIPHCNKQGIRMKERDEFVYFRPRRLRQILDDLD